MACRKHGWVSPNECIDCLEEKRKETQRKEKFVFEAAIYFYDKRWVRGTDKIAADALRAECWIEAVAKKKKKPTY